MYLPHDQLCSMTCYLVQSWSQFFLALTQFIFSWDILQIQIVLGNMYDTNTSCKRVMTFLSPKLTSRPSCAKVRGKNCKCLSQFLGKCRTCGVRCRCLEYYIFKRHEIQEKRLSRKRIQYKSGEPSPLLNVWEQDRVVQDKSWLFHLNTSDIISDEDSDKTLSGTSSDLDSSDESGQGSDGQEDTGVEYLFQ